MRSRGRGAELVGALAPTGPDAVMELKPKSSAGMRCRHMPRVATFLSPRPLYPSTFSGVARLPGRTNPPGGKFSRNRVVAVGVLCWQSNRIQAGALSRCVRVFTCHSRPQRQRAMPRAASIVLRRTLG